MNTSVGHVDKNGNDSNVGFGMYGLFSDYPASSVDGGFESEDNLQTLSVTSRASPMKNFGRPDLSNSTIHIGDGNSAFQEPNVAEVSSEIVSLAPTFYLQPDAMHMTVFEGDTIHENDVFVGVNNTKPALLITSDGSTETPENAAIGAVEFENVPLKRRSTLRSLGSSLAAAAVSSSSIIKTMSPLRSRSDYIKIDDDTTHFAGKCLQVLISKEEVICPTQAMLNFLALIEMGNNTSSPHKDAC
jgi:hypothetical protein